MYGGSQNTFWELILLFYHVDSRDKLRLLADAFPLRTHRTGLEFACFDFVFKKESETANSFGYASQCKLKFKNLTIIQAC